MSGYSLYKEAKEAFVDNIDINRYVQLDSHRLNLERLMDDYKKSFKFVIVHGKPGVGKSMLLKRFEQELEVDPYLHFFYQPFGDLNGFKKTLKQLTGAWSDEDLDGLKRYDGPPLTLVLDEAQLYGSDFLEYIRLLADTSKVRFILSMHQNSNEKLLAKEHFETRIFDSIKVEPPSKKEFLVYIQKRLMADGLAELAQKFDQKRADMIYRYCDGNLRRANRFLYTLFDILEYYEKKQPSLVASQKIPLSFIEMSAIHLGYIDA